MEMLLEWLLTIFCKREIKEKTVAKVEFLPI